MWKDLTLQQKAEIMKMSVANGVTDINDIQQLYDGSVEHRFDDAGRIITVGQFPEGFVKEYGETQISTPSNKNRTTLREAFNDPAWRDLHVDVNSVPYLTDYLLRQDQPNAIRPSEGPTSRTKSVAAYDLWKEQNPGTDAILSVLPVTGTIMNGLELYMHPSLENAGWFATSAALDLVGAKLIGKAAKGLSKADGLSDLTRSRWAAKSKGKPSYYWRGPSKTNKNVFSPEEEEMLLNAAGITGTFMTDLGTNLTQQQIEWNKKALGGYLFDKGGSKNKNQTPKYQYGIIEQILRENGVNFRVTSGFRHPNEAGNAGKSSAHTYALVSGSPAAIDIVPGADSDWNTLYKQMNSPKVRAALASYGLDILDETNPVTMAKTKATGKHFHVGKGIKNQPGKGAFIGSTNPTIAAFNRVYGKPNLLTSNDILYNPAQNLKWKNITPQIPQQIQSAFTLNPEVIFEPSQQAYVTPIEERVPLIRITKSLPSFLSYLPEQQRNVPTQMVQPQIQPIQLDLWNEPYLLFGRI